MENQAFNFTPDISNRNSVLISDGVSPQTNMNSFVQSYFLDHHADLHAATTTTQQAANLNSASALFYSYERSRAARDGSISLGGGDFHDAPPSLQENLSNLAISMPPIFAPQALLPDYGPSSSATPCIAHDEALAGQWDIHQSNLDPTGWISSENGSGFSAVQSYGGSSKFSNGLALTLATSQRSVMSIDPAQCSDSIPANSSDTSEDLSLSFGSRRAAPRLSQVILGSSYLGAMQEILAQIASFALENVDHRSGAGYLIASSSSAGTSTPSSSNCAAESAAAEADPSSDQRRRRAAEAKKAKLLALLQMVDDRYNQCVDEIHTVISAFHAATELDPQIHARFALQTISFLYKGLRERISTECLAMGGSFEADAATADRCFETDFIQKQWALQQMKKKEHQLWRPQRGLPEKSVAVLRAWMFQNFLHPYPKDAEKHLLAIKSGLTRNQVSNWFINARVRLWKPMIEEMYAEMNRRKTRLNENNDGNQRSLTSISNKNSNSLRYNVN